MSSQFLALSLETLVPCLKTLAAAPLTLLTTVSAGLFQDTVRVCNLNGPLLPSFLIVFLLNALFLAHTIRERFYRNTFSCDFVFSLGVSISLIVGGLYTIA